MAESNYIGASDSVASMEESHPGPQTPSDGEQQQPLTPTFGPQDRPIDAHKLLRLGNLAREVLDEVRKCDPGSTPAQDLAALYSRVEKQLAEAVPQSLYDELKQIGLDFGFDESATQQEVRFAYAGLIGWLGGLFQGLQASMSAQAMVRQLEMQSPELLRGEEAVKNKEKEGYL